MSQFFSSKREQIMVLQSTRVGKGWECEKKNGGLKTSGCWLETFATKTRLIYVDLKPCEGDHKLFQA